MKIENLVHDIILLLLDLNPNSMKTENKHTQLCKALKIRCEKKLELKKSLLRYLDKIKIKQYKFFPSKDLALVISNDC